MLTLHEVMTTLYLRGGEFSVEAAEWLKAFDERQAEDDEYEASEPLSIEERYGGKNPESVAIQGDVALNRESLSASVGLQQIKGQQF